MLGPDTEMERIEGVWEECVKQKELTTLIMALLSVSKPATKGSGGCLPCHWKLVQEKKSSKYQGKGTSVVRYCFQDFVSSTSSSTL